MTQKTKDEVIEEKAGKKIPSTHYWIRVVTENYIGDWDIVDRNISNIHIINDPEHFGFEVIPIPRVPTEMADDKALQEAYESGREMERERLLKEINHETDVVQFRANELHVFARSVIDTVIVTQNGKRYEISL